MLIPILALGRLQSADLRTLELAGFALAHATWKADGDGPLIPCAMVEKKDGHKEQYVYATDRLEDCLKMGRADLAKKQANLLAWSFAYEGIERPSGRDLMLVDVWAKAGFRAQIVQPFERVAGRPFRVLGKPRLDLASGKATTAQTNAIMRGINSHEKARGYWKL